MYVDSTDALLRGNLNQAVELLKENNCEMLVFSTKFDVYPCTPELEKWVKSIAEKNGYKQNEKIHINTGVYVAEKRLLKEVVEEAGNYITDNDLPTKKYAYMRQMGKLCEALPDFPKGVGCDQAIIRFMHPKFYPRVKIYYQYQLASRYFFSLSFAGQI